MSKRDVSLTTLVIVHADPTRDALPELPASVATVLRACGQPTLTEQIMLPGQRTDVAEKVAGIAKELNAQLGELVQRARLPYDFSEKDDYAPLGSIGPRKPALLSAFRPLGYECRGEGMMVLVCRRRTASNLGIRLHLDFGTQGDHTTPTYSVDGLGFSAAIQLPVSPSSVGRNLHWLINGARWQQIVANLAALVSELDRSFIPAIEAASGPSPVWYRRLTNG